MATTWNPVTLPQMLSRMTVSEQAMLGNASGAKNALQTRLNDSLAIFQDAILAIGNNVGPTGTICDRFRNAVMALAIGEFLKDFPKLEQFATKQRLDAYNESLRLLDKISNRLAGAISDPNGYQSNGNNFNAQNRIIGRMEPTISPQLQITTQANSLYPYANQNAVPFTPESVVPMPPRNLTVFQSTTIAGQLVLFWEQLRNAMTYNILRGIAAGQEAVTPIATLVYGNTFTDTTCVVGTTYYYLCQAVNQIGTSQNSNEAFNTSIATLAIANPFTPEFVE
jgi:hypothetical protein